MGIELEEDYSLLGILSSFLPVLGFLGCSFGVVIYSDAYEIFRSCG